MPTGALLGAGVAVGGIGSWLSSREQANAAREAGALQAQGQERAAAIYGDAGNIWRDATTQAAAPVQSAIAGAQPYWSEAMATGQGAITSLAQLYGIRTPGNPNPSPAYSDSALANFRNSPEYKFAESEGNKQLEAQYSKAYGGTRGGNQMRGFVEFGQGLAGTTLGNYFNRVYSLAGLGQGAAGQSLQAAGALGDIYTRGAAGRTGAMTGQANAAIGQGTALGNAASGVGQANAAGYVGMANAAQSGLQNYAFLNAIHSAYAQPSGGALSGQGPPQQQWGYM